MLELPIIASVTSLVGTAISTAKNARELAKDSSDHALKGAISDLYDALLDIKDRALSVDEENRALRMQLAAKAKYVGPLPPCGYYFQAENLSNPLCPKCFQAEPQQLSFLEFPEQWGGDRVRRVCRICNKIYFDRGDRYMVRENG